MNIEDKNEVAIIFVIFVFSLADVSSQTVTNAFWGVTWGMKDLDAFYVPQIRNL